MDKYKKINYGFTLVELLVSMSVLLVIAGISTGIFVSVITGQKKIFSDQEIQGQLGYALEYMGKAMRMAGKDLTGDCLGAQGRNYLLTKYSISKQAYMGIKFINQSDNDACQEFYLDFDENDPLKPAVIKMIKGTDAPLSLTSDKIRINFLEFIINGDTSGSIYYSSETDNTQPRITILMDAVLNTGTNNSLKIQTTVSQRNLNIE